MLFLADSGKYGFITPMISRLLLSGAMGNAADDECQENYYMRVSVEQGNILTFNLLGGKISDAFIRICLVRKNAPSLPGWSEVCLYSDLYGYYDHNNTNALTLPGSFNFTHMS